MKVWALDSALVGDLAVSAVRRLPVSEPVRGTAIKIVAIDQVLDFLTISRVVLAIVVVASCIEIKDKVQSLDTLYIATRHSAFSLFNPLIVKKGWSEQTQHWRGGVQHTQEQREPSCWQCLGDFSWVRGERTKVVEWWGVVSLESE